MAGVWKGIRFSKQVQLQMSQINFSLSSNREKKYMSHGAVVFTDGPNVKIHSSPNKVAVEHTSRSGVTMPLNCAGIYQHSLIL